MQQTTAESERLEQDRKGEANWRRWGPYLSERQWGTVREDYSADGAAWDYLPHDHARSRAYRWGEDGLAGISDHEQRLCLSLALWNGNDPILKERLFGLTNRKATTVRTSRSSTTSWTPPRRHSYLRMLYKYPQQPFPYDDLVAGESPDAASASRSTSWWTPASSTTTAISTS